MANLSLNSDRPIDKIIFMREGEITLDQYGQGSASITHGLPATPFMNGVWTQDDWNTTYNFGTLIYDGDTIWLRSSIVASPTRVQITIASWNSAQIKYRVWGVWNEAETQNLQAPTTASSSNALVLSTENYPRLVAEGYANKGTTIQHGLGYIPFVNIWSKYQDSQDWALFDMDGFSPAYGFGEWAKLTKDALIFSGNSGSPDQFYYRIYE